MKKNFTQFDHLYSKTHSLNKLKNNFALLDELNIILRLSIDEHLISSCHVGAIDEDNDTIIIFVTNSQVLYKLKTLSNHLLHRFEQKGFSFNNILIKVSKTQISTTQTIKYKSLDPQYKQKLTEMANRLGKPELIHNETAKDTKEEKEIEF